MNIHVQLRGGYDSHSYGGKAPYIHCINKYGIYTDITFWTGVLVREITQNSLSRHREMPTLSLESWYWARRSPSNLMGRDWRRSGCYRPWPKGGTGLIWALLSDGKYLDLILFFIMHPYCTFLF